MNNVVTQQKAKSDWLQIRISEQLKRDFYTAAELRGLSASALLHSFIVKTIREEKALSPQSFTESERSVNANIELIPDSRIAHFEPIELTDETTKKQKSIRRKAGKR